jgi:hypothetical protein
VGVFLKITPKLLTPVARADKSDFDGLHILPDSFKSR